MHHAERTIPHSSRMFDIWAFLFAFLVIGSASAAYVVNSRLIEQAYQPSEAPLAALTVAAVASIVVLGVGVSWLFRKVDNAIARHSKSTDEAPPPES